MRSIRFPLLAFVLTSLFALSANAQYTISRADFVQQMCDATESASRTSAERLGTGQDEVFEALLVLVKEEFASSARDILPNLLVTASKVTADRILQNAELSIDPTKPFETLLRARETVFNTQLFLLHAAMVHNPTPDEREALRRQISTVVDAIFTCMDTEFTGRVPEETEQRLRQQWTDAFFDKVEDRLTYTCKIPAPDSVLDQLVADISREAQERKSDYLRQLNAVDADVERAESVEAKRIQASGYDTVLSRIGGTALAIFGKVTSDPAAANFDGKALVPGYAEHLEVQQAATVAAMKAESRQAERRMEEQRANHRETSQPATLSQDSSGLRDRIQ